MNDLEGRMEGKIADRWIEGKNKEAVMKERCNEGSMEGIEEEQKMDDGEMLEGIKDRWKDER